MAKNREIRDPVHGFVERSRLEEKIIDTQVFQRLRRIRQLAMASLVYPGALHTRFDHSIGVMHVADKLARQLLPSKDYIKQRKTIRLAALLHDVGHGPFSHVSEDILELYIDKDKVKPQEKEEIHELITCDIITKNPELSRIISQQERSKIIDLLKGEKGEPLIHSIISGPLDADKQDYLLRDSYFCGVKYGIFDMGRLIGTLMAVPDPQGRILAASNDGVYAIEQFVLAKYHMAKQVYFHRLRLITDAMIVRALSLGIEKDNLPWLRRLYKYDGSDEYIQNYLDWDDAKLMNCLLSANKKDTLAGELFTRLKERRLFKKIFAINLREIQDEIARKQLSGLARDSQLRMQIETEIAKHLSSMTRKKIKPYQVIAKQYTFKSVRKAVADESIVIIVGESGKRNFDEESALFNSIDKKQSEEYLEVYAPFKLAGRKANNERAKALQKDIARILIDAAKEGDTGVKKGGSNVA